VRREVINWVYDQPDEAIFKVEAKPDFTYKPVKGSFNKTNCSAAAMGKFIFKVPDDVPAL
jgi:formylmethanofuran dehydrogenase subunit E